MLGNTGIPVSRLCFGSLAISPLQADLPVQEGAAVIRYAFERGVNFIDTAELYQNYSYIREALKGYPQEVVIATKCYAYLASDMYNSLKRALKEMNREYIDIFMLHEQESADTIRGHWDALEYLLRAKEKGIIRAVGLSTHHIACVEAAAKIPEIDVIHPLYNYKGIGIRDGTAGEMLSAIKAAKEAGKGLYGMKALAGGHLLSDAERALKHVLSINEFDAIAVGMQSPLEVEYNTRLFNGQPISKDLYETLRRKPRKIIIEDWCVKCGRCVKACKSRALSLTTDKLRVFPEKCCLCGYCAAACPEFCIKVI